MPLPYLFSSLFLIASAILLFYGLFILSQNAKSAINIIFFTICLSLSVWSFALSISNTAQDYDMCLFWRRIGSFGWGTFFSFLIHFIIILTERGEILKKKWIYLLIYLPAGFSVFVFGLYSDVAVGTYNLVETYAGWVNISYNSLFDLLFNIYYISFSLAGIILLFFWANKFKEKDRRNQVYIICILFLLAVIIGTLSEFVINYMFSFKIPQIVPIVFLFPMTVMFFCVKRYGIVIKKQNNSIENAGRILNEDNRTKLYFYISVVYLFGGFINIGAMYFTKRDSLKSVLIFCALMSFISLSLQIIQILKIKLNYKDLLSNIILSISIPIILLKYFNYLPIYAGILPIIFIISSIAFSQRRILVLNGISILFTLIWIWIKAPSAEVVFTAADHFIRILLLCIIFSMAFYINSVYTQRLFENEEKLNMQKLLSRISSIFINTNESNLEDRINEVLGLCGKNFKMEHVYVILFSEGKKGKNFFQWCCQEKVLDKICDKEESKKKILELLNMKQFLQEECLCISDLAATSEEGLVKEYMEDKEIKNTIINPLRDQDYVIGLIGFESTNNKTKFKEYQKETLKVLAHLISDVVLKVDAEKEINYRANYDALTGLPNRVMFMNQLNSGIKMAQRSEKLVGVAFIDIDSFKYINDTLGHDGGDDLLMKIGEKISGSLRLYDVVARFGGDEFVIMIPQVTYVEDICSVAEKITDSFKQPVKVGGQEFFITVSMGVSVFPLDGTDSEDLVINADAAMYISKQNGKNKYTMCSSFLQKEIEVNARLTNSLHIAIQKKEFLLKYQPQVNAKTGEIVGAEALIRWNHPKKGMILPGVFIPLAEKNGLINNIGQWVLYEACEQNKAWQKIGLKPIKMAVNLSLGQFLNPNLVNIVEEVLKKTELDPAYLELEITESIATYDPDYIINTLNDLKSLGVMISIDDFGTEYSSLSRLKLMPVDKIKIDMRFIQGIFSGSKDESIIKAMLQLGKTFGLEVLAEGVETKEQLEFLKENLCDEIQGYYFYKPMSAQEFKQILK